MESIKETTDTMLAAIEKHHGLMNDEKQNLFHFERSEEPEFIDMTQAGQPCRVCSTPVVRRVPRSKLKPGQTYFFEYYLECPSCKATYMVEEAKRLVEEAPTLF